ncbi:MAG TPA: S41 family peptidase [Casimicrobiaceae bacterium]|nr:S41 family peptidase [Casimicrobiaceae bacterium]
MRDHWKKAGLIGLGAVLGLLLSLNFSAVAQREAKLPIPYEDLQLLSAVFGKIKSDYVEPVSDEKLIREAINGMVRGLDPHSDFLDADAFKELQVSTQGKFGGLGIEVGIEDGAVRVISPIEDTPAFRAGIKTGDLIVKIDDTATRGMPLSKAVEKMRGKPGTEVVLTIFRKEVDQPFAVTLLREEINVKSVRAKMLEPGYGYIRIRNFQERTSEDLARSLKDFYKQGELKGLVLDVRSDPGGLLNQAVGVSAAFLPRDALVVYTDGRTPDARMRFTASRESYSRGRGEDWFKDLPAAVKKVSMVVLVDGGTASASEIVAGALQDHKRATVMGASTFGKGSVQTILPLGNTAGLKLTTARYYTPSGRSIQAKGIEPDIHIDDGRESPNRIREANLGGHLETNRELDKAIRSAPPAKGPPGVSIDPVPTPLPTTPKPSGPPEPPLPRFDFGSVTDDFQLRQAINHLKGEPVVASIRSQSAAAKTPATAAVK